MTICTMREFHTTAASKQAKKKKEKRKKTGQVARAVKMEKSRLESPETVDRPKLFLGSRVQERTEILHPSSVDEGAHHPSKKTQPISLLGGANPIASWPREEAQKKKNEQSANPKSKNSRSR